MTLPECIMQQRRWQIRHPGSDRAPGSGWTGTAAFPAVVLAGFASLTALIVMCTTNENLTLATVAATSFVILFVLTLAAGIALRPQRQRAAYEASQRVDEHQPEATAANKGWPRLSRVSPYALGVHRGKHDGGNPPKLGEYIPRTADRELRRKLRNGPFVLVEGPPLAGKSRTLLEAARSLPGEWHDPTILVLRPASIHVEVGRACAAGGRRPILFWLTGLDRDSCELLTSSFFDRVVAVRGLVVAEATSTIYAELVQAGFSSDLLSDDRVVHLDAHLDGDETAAAAGKYPHEDLRYCIGASFVADTGLVAHFRALQSDHPAAWALVRIAVDWTRMGVRRGITEAELSSLLPDYLGIVSPHAPRPRDLAADLTEACRRTRMRRPALGVDYPEGDPRYFAAPELVHLVADGRGGADPMIPVAAWYKTLNLRDPYERRRVAATAEKHGQAGVAALLNETRQADRRPSTSEQARPSHYEPVGPVAPEPLEPPARTRRTGRVAAMAAVWGVVLGVVMAALMSSLLSEPAPSSADAGQSPALSPPPFEPPLAPAPTTTARATPGLPPVEDGTVTLAPGVPQNPDSELARSLLTRYFTALNTMNYDAYVATVVTPQKDRDEFRYYEDISHDSVQVYDVRSEQPGTLVASVSFASNQPPSEAPNGLNAPRVCWQQRMVINRLDEGGKINTNKRINLKPPDPSEICVPTG